MKKHSKESRRLSCMVIGVLAGILPISLVCNAFMWPSSSPQERKDGSIHPVQDAHRNILLLTGSQDSRVEKALSLDNQFHLQTNIPFNSSILATNETDVVVVCNYHMSPAEAGNLSEFMEAGGNILFMFGPDSMGEENLFQGIGMEITSSPNHDNIGINYTTGKQDHPIVEKVQWSSAPSIWNRSVVGGVNGSFEILLRNDNAPFDPLLFSYPLPAGSEIMVITPWLVPEADNLQLELWPYFNYMIYLTVDYLASPDPSLLPSFHEWGHSPVPHFRDTITIAIIVCILGVLAFSLFSVQRRRSKRSSIILTDQAIEEMNRREREAMEKEKHEDLTDEWEQIGTHKQISGFLFGLFAGILLGIPQIVLTGIIFPRWIMPYPQVAGWFDWVKQFFQAIWMIFDVGTSIALAKYFAQYRIKQPQKAVHYIQIFVWWQILSGVVQIIMISLLGSIVFPRTNFAHLSWLVVLHSLIQYPGFFVVFMYIFQGMQRTDLQNLANLLYQAILMLGFQYLFIVVFRYSFSGNPQGEAFWAGIGYAVGQYVAEWSIFFIMMRFYKKLGFSVSTIFRVDFTRKEFKEALVFGGKEALGHVWVPLAYMFQVWILGAFLPNYNEQMGLYGYANMLMQVTALVGFLTEGFLAPVSEAHAHDKEKLLELTVSQGLKWSNFIEFYMIALLAATASPFIIFLAGEAWAGATRFIPLLLIYSLMQPWAWLGDKILAGTGYTGRAALIWIVEQGGKMLLLGIYILGFGVRVVEVILYAHIPVLVIKCILSWMTIRKLVTAPKAYLWNSWIAPAIASLVVFAILKVLTLIFVDWLIIIEFVLAIFVLFFVYSFLCGFLGCYDKNTIEEYRKASLMVGAPLSIFAKGLYKAAKLGCKLNPKLHDRFPIDVFEAAMVEAKALEREKLKLEI